MGGGSGHSSCGGPHLTRTRVGRFNRGSSKKIQRIKFGDNTPPQFVAQMLFTIAIVVAVLAWLIHIAS
jgi:hypothetical protein